MNYSPIDICSMSLLKIGANTISNFNENSASAKICSTFYDLTKRKLLSSHPWTFATFTITLPKLDETPNNEFSSCYLLPKQVLRIISISPNIPYKIMKDRLYCNAQMLQIKAVINTDESELPPFFINLLVDNLSYEICLPLTEDYAKAKYLKDNFTILERQAKLIDSQQKTPEKIVKFTLNDIRS